MCIVGIGKVMTFPSLFQAPQLLQDLMLVTLSTLPLIQMSPNCVMLMKFLQHCLFNCVMNFQVFRGLFVLLRF